MLALAPTANMSWYVIKPSKITEKQLTSRIKKEQYPNSTNQNLLRVNRLQIIAEMKFDFDHFFRRLQRWQGYPGHMDRGSNSNVQISCTFVKH